MGKFIDNKTRVRYLTIWSSHPLNETFNDRLAISSLFEWNLEKSKQTGYRERKDRKTKTKDLPLIIGASRELYT